MKYEVKRREEEKRIMRNTVTGDGDDKSSQN